MFAERKCVPSPKSKSRFSKPSPTKPSSPSRTCACSRRFRSATQNCARRSSIRQQLSEVLGIISRSPTDVQPVLDAIVESAARVCGIDDVVLRLRDENILVHGLILVPYPCRVEISIDEPQYCWMREHGTLHIADRPRRREMISQRLGSLIGLSYLLGRPLLQQGELIGC